MFMRMFIMTSLVMKESRCVTSLQPSSVSCKQQQHNIQSMACSHHGASKGKLTLL